MHSVLVAPPEPSVPKGQMKHPWMRAVPRAPPELRVLAVCLALLQPWAPPGDLLAPPVRLVQRPRLVCLVPQERWA